MASLDETYASLSDGPDKVILHPGPHQNVQLGQNLTVSCSAVCKPPCNVSWTVGSRLVSSDSLLTLQDIQKDEELNVYKCTAFNPVTAKYRSDYFMLHISEYGVICSFVCNVHTPVVGTHSSYQLGCLSRTDG